MDKITTANVVAALNGVFDPEVGINVVDLGLIYRIEIQGRDLRVAMTMTTPACPLGSYLSQAAERAIRSKIPEVMGFDVELVWQPQWNPSMMSQAARREMGWRE